MQKKGLKMDSNNTMPTLIQVAFIGQFVEIITKLKRRQYSESEEGVFEEDANAVVTGYLIDYDGEFFYLGKDPDNLTTLIDKNEISFIEIIQPKEEFDSILDDMPIPTGENGNN